MAGLEHLELFGRVFRSGKLEKRLNKRFAKRFDKLLGLMLESLALDLEDFPNENRLKSAGLRPANCVLPNWSVRAILKAKQ